MVEVISKSIGVASDSETGTVVHALNQRLSELFPRLEGLQTRGPIRIHAPAKGSKVGSHLLVEGQPEQVEQYREILDSMGCTIPTSFLAFEQFKLGPQREDLDALIRLGVFNKLHDCFQ